MSFLPPVPPRFSREYLVELVRQLEREFRRRPSKQSDGTTYIGHESPFTYVDAAGNQYELGVDVLPPGPALDVNNTWTGANTFSGSHTVASPTLLQGEVWNTPTLLNGWENYGGSFPTVQYRKLPNGMVLLKGLTRNGTDTTNIFVLPAGYRPAEQHIFGQMSAGPSIGRIDIKSDGGVLAQGVSTAWVSLSSIMFLAEQ